MKQLSLFNDMDEVHYIMSLTPTEFVDMKKSLPTEVFHKIIVVRNAVRRWNVQCSRADDEYKASLASVGIYW